MECVNCENYVKKNNERSCIWFETKISLVFPAWKEKFKTGEVKFRKCGFGD